MKKVVVGLDCEMVGLGDKGKENALARCSLVDFDGNVLYDKIIRPKGFVTDFRTKWSGIKKSDLRKDKDNVVTLEECQKAVAELLKNKILVGHALQNDFRVLLLSHPRSKIRDTSFYRPYMRVSPPICSLLFLTDFQMRGKFGKFRPRSLKELSKEFLGKEIQTGEHDSVEDARMAVLLYRREMESWERMLVEKRREGAAKTNDSSAREGDAGSSADEKEDGEGEGDEGPEAEVGAADEEVVLEEVEHVRAQLLAEEAERHKKKRASVDPSSLLQAISQAKQLEQSLQHQARGSKRRRDPMDDAEPEPSGPDSRVLVFEDHQPRKKSAVDRGRGGQKSLGKKNKLPSRR